MTREQLVSGPIGVRMVNIDFYPLLGGAQMHTLRLSRYLRENGVDVEVITRHHTGLPHHEVIQGVPVYRTPILHPSKAAASLSFQYYALRHLAANRSQVQIVHSHEMLSPMTIGLLSRALLGTRLVINPHRGGYLGDVWKLQQRRKVTGAARLAWARSQGDAFISVSKQISAELSACGISEEKIHFIPYALDTEHFRPASPEQRAALRQQFGLGDAVTACYTGRLVEEKGLDVLVEAWRAVSSHLGNARLLIIGDGPQRQKLKAQIDASGLQNQVSLTGAVEDTLHYLQACDLYVQSSFTEGLPISMLEAMACGLPVLATNVGGVGDLLVEETNGLLARPHDVDSLAGPLVKLVTGTAMRASLGEEARKDVVRCCAIETVGRKHLELYAALLHRGSQPVHTAAVGR